MNIVPQNMTAPVVPESRPLDTADWSQDYQAYQAGDFWLGRHLYTGDPVGLNDDRHILLNCAARGGKGISYIIPNLCLWQGSTVVIDPKGENAIVTARSRSNGSDFAKGMGQKVKILDPFNTVKRDTGLIGRGNRERESIQQTDSFSDLKAHFNPLDMLDIDRPESVDDAARIAEAIIVSGPTGGNETFWDEAAI